MNEPLNQSDVNKQIISFWSNLHIRHKSAKTPWITSTEIELITTNLISLQEYSISKTKEYKNLLKLLNILKNNKISNMNRWYEDFYLNLTSLVQKLGVYVQKEGKRAWGTYLFSKIFPKTFAYLKEYVPLRYLQYQAQEIPNPKVFVFSTSQKKINHFFDGFGGMAYNPESLKIELNLTLWSPMFPKSNEEVYKLLNYFDSLTKYQSMLVHEYEHVLQHKIVKFSLFKPSTWFASEMSDHLPKEIGVRLIHEFDSKFPEFNKARARIVSYSLNLDDSFLKKLNSKFNIAGKNIIPHNFRPVELEAFLSQLIFFLSKGNSLEKSMADMEIFTIYFDYKSYQNLLPALYNTERHIQERLEISTDENEKTEIKKTLPKLERQISITKQIINDWEFLIEEAQKIAAGIISKRQAIEI